MTNERVWVPSHVFHEVLGDDVVVHVPGGEEGSRPSIVTLTGPVADVFRRAHSGDPSVTTDSEHVRDLIGVGILHARIGADVPRRNLFAAGAVGLGAGIAMLALPQVAVASSDAAELSGSWLFSGANDMDFLAGSGGNTIVGSPALTVVGIAGVVPFQSFDSSSQIVRWRREFDPGTRPTVSGTLIGTFTSGDQNYRVTFADVVG